MQRELTGDSAGTGLLCVFGFSLYKQSGNDYSTEYVLICTFRMTYVLSCFLRTVQKMFKYI